jgi:prolipoprotein diacylglyceryltransferase
VALFSLGRFFEFFARSDSPEFALGLNNAQWTSLGLLLVALVGWWLTIGRTSKETPADHAGQ